MENQVMELAVNQSFYVLLFVLYELKLKKLIQEQTNYKFFEYHL